MTRAILAQLAGQQVTALAMYGGAIGCVLVGAAIVRLFWRKS